MPKPKIAISLDESTLQRLDDLVKKASFPSRSQAIQDAAEEKLARLDRNRSAGECATLDPVFEKALAEEGLSDGKLVNSQNTKRRDPLGRPQFGSRK